MPIEVLGDNTVSVVVTDGSAVAVNIDNSQQSGVNAYGGIGPTIFVNGTATGVIGTIGINPFLAGANITVTTTGGSITIHGRPDQTPATIPSVIVDMGGDRVTLADDIGEIESQIDVVINQILPGASAPVGRLLATGPAGVIRTAASYVASVQGRTGDVWLSNGDVNAAPFIHSHNTASIAGLTSAIRTFSSVTSVQGRTGAVTVSLADVTAAPSVHTHTTSDISSFTTSVRAIGNVVSVNGMTGTVTVTQSKIASQFAGNTTLADDVQALDSSIASVRGRFFGGVTAPSGLGVVVSGDGVGIRTSTGFVHSISGATGTVTLSAGPNITLSVAGSNITISAAANTAAVAAALWPAFILGG